MNSFDIVVREVPQSTTQPEPEGAEPLDSAAHYAGELMATLAVHSVRLGFGIGRSAVQRASRTRLGRVLSEIAEGVLEGVAAEPGIEWREASRIAEQQLERVISVMVPVVVQSVDPMELLEALDVNAVIAEVDIGAVVERVDLNDVLARVDLAAVLSRVDLDELLGRLDVDALLQQVDTAALIERIDVGAIVERIDVEAVLARVDMSGLLDRIDVDGLVNQIDVAALLERVDLEAVLSRLDLAGFAKQAKVGELVVESTQEVTNTALDLGRRQAVAVDTLLARVIDRALGRATGPDRSGPPGLLEAGGGVDG